MTIPGKVARAIGESAAQTPDRKRVEAGDQYLALGNQHALDFTQNLVRVVMELEDMRHDQGVDAVRGERQLTQIADDVDWTRRVGDLA